MNDANKKTFICTIVYHQCTILFCISLVDESCIIIVECLHCLQEVELIGRCQNKMKKTIDKAVAQLKSVNALINSSMVLVFYQLNDVS